MNYQEEIIKIDDFIRQEHYKEAGNTMGGILENALRETYLDMKIKSTAEDQKVLLDLEVKHGRGKSIYGFMLGQLLGLYKEGNVFNLIEKYNNINLNRTYRLPLNDLNDIRNRCAHPSEEAKITLDELEFFLSNLKILLRELEILNHDEVIRERDVVDNDITCPACEKTSTAGSNFCTYCGCSIKSNSKSLNWADYKVFNDNIKIDGEYITKYEDIENGERIIVNAKAELFHNEGMVTGYTYLNDNSRRWLIEGKISSNGYFYGIYYAENPIDKGIGNFFLQIYNNKIMDGLWSGYDSVNSQITSGKYVFKPVYKNIKLAELEKRYIPQIIKISDKELGKDYLSDSDLKDVIEKKEQTFSSVVLNLENNKIIGFVLSHLISTDHASKVISWPGNNVPKVFEYINNVGFIKTVVVEKNFQGFGIGYKLIEKSYRDMLENGADFFVSIAWKNGEKVNVGSILENLGFQLYAEVDNYWMDESHKYEFHCPACGSPPCKCKGLIYTKDVFE